MYPDRKDDLGAKLYCIVHALVEIQDIYGIELWQY
jgi:hypothetical protein